MAVRCQEVFRAILGFEELKEGHFNPVEMAIRERIREMLLGERAVDPQYVRMRYPQRRVTCSHQAGDSLHAALWLTVFDPATGSTTRAGPKRLP